MKPPAILIAVLSGLASALLFAGLVLQSASALSLALAAPIPIAIASLGWGSAAGFIAAGAATATIAAIAPSALSALTLLASMALPTAISGHLAGLARPSEDAPSSTGSPTPVRWPGSQAKEKPRLDWYPISRILLAISISAVVACIFLGWVLGFDPEALVPEIAKALGEGAAGGTSDEQIRQVAHAIVGLVPFIQPAVLTITLVVGLYLGAAIVRFSGRLPRPRDDLPTSTMLPKIALIIFGVGVLGAFIGGTVGTLAAVVVGSFGMAFTLVGLASVHRRSRGKPGRILILILSYGAILLLSFPIVLFTAIGFVETWMRPERPSSAHS